MAIRCFAVVAAIAAAAGLTACATADNTVADDEYRPPVYRTGSNLPARDSDKSQVKNVDPAEFEKLRSRGGRVGQP